MSFLELAKERYSVRKMGLEKIKKEDLDKVLEAARLSPTAKNLQRERLLVIFNKCRGSPRLHEQVKANPHRSRDFKSTISEGTPMLSSKSIRFES